MDLPVEPRSNIALADYTWLPAEHQQAFQATLETDEGVAAVHFVAEIDRMTRKQYQRRVVVVSADALYLCTTTADITRCILLDRIQAVLTCDEWVCLCIPDEYDLAFRITPNGGAQCHQRWFLDTLAALSRVATGRVPQCSTVSSIHALASRQLERPSGFNDRPPVPIDVLRYGTIAQVQNAELLVKNLLPQHAAGCNVRVREQHAAGSPARAPQPVEVETMNLDPSPTRQDQVFTNRQPDRIPQTAPTPAMRFADAEVSPLRAPQQLQRSTRDAALSPIQPPAPSRREAETITSPPSPRSPKGAAQSTTSNEVLWEELRAQRNVIEELQKQIGLLVADRYPTERRPVERAGESVVGHAREHRLPYALASPEDAPGFVEDDAPTRRHKSPKHRDESASKPVVESSRHRDPHHAHSGGHHHHRDSFRESDVDSSAALPRENAAARLRRESGEAARYRTPKSREEPSMAWSQPKTRHGRSRETPDRRKFASESPVRPPRRVEEAVDGLGELSSFQRQLMADMLRGREVSPHALDPPHRRASPENPHPAPAMFVRTKFPSPAKHANQRRASVAAGSFYADSVPHHQRTTTNSRSHQRAATSGRR